jgi:hypothetical protein
LEKSGTVVRAGTPAEFAQAIEDQRAKVAAVIQSQPKIQ